MRSQKLKDFYYATLGALSHVNKLRLNIWNPYLSHPRLILNLGSGTHPLPFPGFVNVDGNWFRKPDIWLDITRGLPFSDESVAGIYASHVVEHFTERQLRRLFGNCFRVLKPGGIIRLVTPDLRKSVDAYVRQDKQFFSDFPTRRDSLGGRFNNHLLCDDQHRLMFDFTFLSELLTKAGFVQCRDMTPSTSARFNPEELGGMSSEHESSFSSLFVEAEKPAIGVIGKVSRNSGDAL